MSLHAFPARVHTQARTCLMLVGVTLLGGLAAGCHAGKPAAALPEASTHKAAETKGRSREEAWASVAARLEQADREAEQASLARIAELDAFFAERKQGARPFAEEILGYGAKLEHAAALADRGVNKLGKAIGDLFKSDDEKFADLCMIPLPGEGEDPYIPTASNIFERHVMSGTSFKSAAESAATGFVSDLQGLESRLLVDLRADLADDALDLGESSTAVENSTGIREVNAALTDVLSTARTDLGVTVAQESLSFVVGNKVGDAFAQGASSAFGKLLLNLTGNLAVDQALGAAKGQAGYDAEAEVVARVEGALDTIRNKLVGGDAPTIQAFYYLVGWCECHPDPAVRNACVEAADVIERSGKLGLNYSLWGLYRRRADTQRTALYRLIFGPNANPPWFQSIDPKTLPSNDAFLNYARQCAAYWKGQER